MEESPAAKDQPIMVVSDFCGGSADPNGKLTNEEDNNIQQYSQKGK